MNVHLDEVLDGEVHDDQCKADKYDSECQNDRGSNVREHACAREDDRSYYGVWLVCYVKSTCYGFVVCIFVYTVFQAAVYEASCVGGVQIVGDLFVRVVADGTEETGDIHGRGKVHIFQIAFDRKFKIHAVSDDVHLVTDPYRGDLIVGDHDLVIFQIVADLGKRIKIRRPGCIGQEKHVGRRFVGAFVSVVIVCIPVDDRSGFDKIGARDRFDDVAGFFRSKSRRLEDDNVGCVILLSACIDGALAGEHQGETRKEKECSQEDQDKKDRDLALVFLDIISCNEKK